MERPLGSRYRIEELIGRGGMGAVYRGRDTDGRRVAIKVLRPELAGDPDVVTRFVRERTVLTGVHDPSLVAVHDLVVEGDTLAIVMEFVDGPDLRAVLRERGTLPPAEVARIGTQLCGALAAAHARGVLHRDIKPENVLVDAAAALPRVRLADFGIARLIGDSRLSRTTALIGTPTYLPPEVYGGEAATPAGDLYALGVLLYELCCGVPPFVGDVIAVMSGHVGLQPARPDGIPDRLWGLLAALLEKEPARRPASAAALPASFIALEAALAGLPAAPALKLPPAGGPVSRPWQTSLGTVALEQAQALVSGEEPERKVPARRTRVLIAAAAMVGAATLGAGAVWGLTGEAALNGQECDRDSLSVGCGSVAEIRKVQRRLVELCYFIDNGLGNVNADGVFGPATETAVQRFQIVNDLVVDGRLSSATRGVLFDRGAKPDPQASPCR